MVEVVVMVVEMTTSAELLTMHNNMQEIPAILESFPTS
jgi:hypothetical protein